MTPNRDLAFGKIFIYVQITVYDFHNRSRLAMNHQICASHYKIPNAVYIYKRIVLLKCAVHMKYTRSDLVVLRRQHKHTHEYLNAVNTMITISE